jgi:hypothetical protein
MTAIAARMPAGHYRFRHVARMEWIKLRSLRSTWWTLVITVAGTIGIGVAVGMNTTNGTEDLTNNMLGGVVPGLLLAGVLGVLTMTSEYSSGMIRATLAAIPRRPQVVAAKAAVAGAAALRHGIPSPALSQPGVLRAVVLSGASFCLIGLLGLGIGAIIRHSAAAIAVLVGGVYVVATFIGDASHAVGAYMPIMIVGNSLSTTRPQTCGGSAAACGHLLSAWAGLGMLCLYAAVALALGSWLLARRDA